MKGMLPSLTGIVLCTLASHSAASDPTVPLPTKPGEELHAAVTDMPDIIDMSYADPKIWHSLPPAGQLYDACVKQEVAEKHGDRGNG